MKLFVLDELYAIVRLGPDAELPGWARGGHFWSVTRTESELSIVCAQDDVPDDESAERGWCALEVSGPPLDFSLTGVVASLVTPLADAAIPIFVLSTFETDYLLVRERDLEPAVEALTAAGHAVDG
ncbi:MAG TPA: ACT domain-containing protein [Gaiellaceae bacterium]|nr:ACT domain-containing protein [Gaiellaceae bacterium]